MKRYRCPKCGAVAEIDLANKMLIAEPLPPNITGILRQIAVCFPSHQDCEFNKPITEINLSSLEEVKDHEFTFQKTVQPL